MIEVPSKLRQRDLWNACKDICAETIRGLVAAAAVPFNTVQYYKFNLCARVSGSRAVSNYNCVCVMGAAMYFEKGQRREKGS